MYITAAAQHKPLPGAYHSAIDESQPCAFPGTLDLAHSGPERGPIDCPFCHAHNRANAGTV
jgi:hypothetical protein